MQIAKIGRWFQEIGIAILVAGVTITLSSNRAIASEVIIFTYGAATQSVPFEELQTFVETGEKSSSIDFLLSLSKQNPLLMRRILKQKFPADTQLVSDLLNTTPGEYVLSQTGNVVGSKSRRANVTALRGSLIRSASDDGLVSLIELFEHYPTEQVYVNGKIISRVQNNINQFVEETNRYIKLPASLLRELNLQ
jgi:hypothetical protein